MEVESADLGAYQALRLLRVTCCIEWLRTLGGDPRSRDDAQALDATSQPSFALIALARLLAVILQHLLADFSQFFAMVLQAREHPKGIREDVAAEFGGVGAARSLFFGGTAENISLRIGRLRLRRLGGDSRLAGGQNNENNCVNSHFHCLCLNVVHPCVTTVAAWRRSITEPGNVQRVVGSSRCLLRLILT